jgi:hypothetical protein
VEEDKRNPCCREEKNLIPQQERPDLLVKTCMICHCRHLEFQTAPGIVGVVGAKL